MMIDAISIIDSVRWTGISSVPKIGIYLTAYLQPLKHRPRDYSSFQMLVDVLKHPGKIAVSYS